MASAADADAWNIFYSTKSFIGRREFYRTFGLLEYSRDAIGFHQNCGILYRIGEADTEANQSTADGCRLGDYDKG